MGQEEAPRPLLRVKTSLKKLRVQFWSLVSQHNFPLLAFLFAVSLQPWRWGGGERLSLTLAYRASLEVVQIRLSSVCTRGRRESTAACLRSVGFLPHCNLGREVQVGSLVTCECTLVWNKSCYLYLKRQHVHMECFLFVKHSHLESRRERCLTRKPSLSLCPSCLRAHTLDQGYYCFCSFLP